MLVRVNLVMKRGCIGEKWFIFDVEKKKTEVAKEKALLLASS